MTLSHTLFFTLAVKVHEYVPGAEKLVVSEARAPEAPVDSDHL
jgi:hypothetical protein